MKFEYKIGGVKYDVQVVKKRNKNTYVKVKDDLTIYVTTNFFATKSYIKNLLDNENEFLKKSIERVKKRKEMDEEFYYLGKKYDIILIPFNNIEIDDNRIYVNSMSYLEKWLKNETLRIYKERLNYNYNLFEENIPFPKLKIRNMKTRWGVCNKRDDSITLNSKLIRYNIREIDYVIIHELSHFVHFDHSRQFWNTVSYYMPEYKKAIKILKSEVVL